MATKQLLQTLIKENPVLLLSKTYCPYCTRAKGVMKEYNVQTKIIELDQESNGADLQNAVKEEFSHRTVPAIWIKQKFIGGCDSLLAAQSSGELDKLLGKSN